MLFFNTHPFDVKTYKNERLHWVENILTGKRVSAKNLTKEQADEFARVKHLELIEATGCD